MPQHPFKKAGLLRTGFEYQDLIGIELLIAFYRDPSLYAWVKLEAEDVNVGSLDDVVAARADGSLDLVQVKFTPDPEEYLLDWEWLLETKGKGTSRLAKWARSIEETKKLGSINSAVLRTNRRPSIEFAKVLSDRRVELARIGADLRTRIEADLGGSEHAASFFAEFVFSHSEPLIDEFELKLMGRLVPTDTDTGGWLLLREQARRWASRKTEPAPDGRITHQHLVQIIARKRPRPIPQDFLIPDVYCEPNSEFTNAFVERAATQPISILWGTPGRGKSTYLSWLVEQMHQRETPVIRHHYFLTLSDATSDRYSVASIASSLIDQIVVRYGEAVQGMTEDTERLRPWIEACGAYYAKQGKRFTIVIDGLDHVWREQGDATHLNHLFSKLLPLPGNVSLIVGTQRVLDVQLPSRLLQHSAPEDWIEIPAMDTAAVHRWVRGQHDAGRVILDGRRSESLTHLGQAFFDISLGHPLHLIYSFETMVRSGEPFSVEAIRLLPPCPDGDIRKYYRTLWARLSVQAKQVMHLIAGSPFHWPSVGLRKCAGPTDDVDHLLVPRRSGVAPFHGSILAYVRAQPDHEDAFKALIPVIIKWLESDAPEFWQWGWLWIMRAADGDSGDLTQLTTRKWVHASLVGGWPREQIIAILAKAEQATFAARDYARTMEIRSLKVRLLNASEFQMSKFAEFEETAIRLANNVQHVFSLADAIPTLPDSRLVTLAHASPAHAADIRAECLQELRRRVNIWISLRHKPENEFYALTRRFLDVLAVAPIIDAAALTRFLAGFRDSGDMIWWTLECFTRERRFDALLELEMEVGRFAKTKPYRRLVQDALVRVAAFEGIDLNNRLHSKAASSPLLFCWRRYHGTTPSALAAFSGSKSSGRAALEASLHDTFFRTLAARLGGHDAPSYVDHIPKEDGDWLAGAFASLQATAASIVAGQAQLSFSTPYFHAAKVEPIDQRGEARDHYFAFKSALRAIAIDLHCLKSPACKTPKLYKEEVDAARASQHWVEELWVEDQLARRLTLWDQSAAKVSIDAAAGKDARTITVFNERADKWTDLARLSELHGLESAPALLGRAADCVLGYGWRKDLWLDDVLDAIVDVHNVGAADGLALLAPLVPIVDQITEFTDGDETDHVRSALIRSVASVCPDRLSQFYAHHLLSGDFRYADEALEALLERLDFARPEAEALAHTLLDRRNVQVMVRLGRNVPRANVLANRQLRFLGGMPISHEREYANTPEGERDPPPDFRDFSPDKFSDLIKAASSHNVGYRARQECLRKWLHHWRERGKGIEAISAITRYMEAEDNPTHVDDILDDIFDVSLALQGREAAYPWLVRAHIHRYGWSYWFGGKEALARIDLAAQHYADRWQRYIDDASRQTEFWQRRGREEFTFSPQYLAHFLLRVGQTERAVALVKACVGIVCDEVLDQPIPDASWFN